MGNLSTKISETKKSEDSANAPAVVNMQQDGTTPDPLHVGGAQAVATRSDADFNPLAAPTEPDDTTNVAAAPPATSSKVGGAGTPPYVGPPEEPLGEFDEPQPNQRLLQFNVEVV